MEVRSAFAWQSAAIADCALLCFEYFRDGLALNPIGILQSERLEDGGILIDHPDGLLTEEVALLDSWSDDYERCP